MISTSNTSKLPDVHKLKHLAQSLAMLDAIIMPEWEFRYYSFQRAWAAETDLFTMRNGSGDDFLIIFWQAHAVIKGFDHESPVSPYRTYPPSLFPGILDDFPAVLTPLLSEPAFSFENTTFCLWCNDHDATWRHGKLPILPDEDLDGSASLLYILDGDPATYQRWAVSYYERSFALDDVALIYRHVPLTEDLIHRLNPQAALDEVQREAEKIGYPAL